MRILYFSIIAICFPLSSCRQATKTAPYDVIVIGGGLMGSAAAWHLSKADMKVLLIEKQDSIYTEGSSYGEARIARSNNRGNDIWSYLHNRSLKETSQLVSFLNENATDRANRLEDVYTTSPVTYVGRIGIYDRLMASLIRQDVTYDIAITPEEGREKFGVILPDSVLIQREFNLHSGTMNPKALISLLHQAVRQSGGDVKYGHQVEEVNIEEKTGYRIQVSRSGSGKRESFDAAKIVSAAGPYTGTLLKDIAPYFDRLIDPQRVFLAFLKINPSVYGSLTDKQKSRLTQFYPVINSSKGTRDGSFFSMIEFYDEQNHPIIKIGGHFQRSGIDNLDDVWKKDLTDSEIEWSLNGTSDYMKMLNLPIAKSDLELIDGYSCVYSLTQTEVPYVTPILTPGGDRNSDFVVMGGMSGVGAKGAMTYGLIAADLILGRTQVDSMHLVTTEAVGFDRLVKDVEALQ